MSNNTTTKTKAAGNGSGGAGNNSNKGSSTNPKKNPKQKNKQQPKQKQQQSKPKQPPKVAIDPPLECVKSDFEALLGDAAGLADYQEASAELMDCARYGEVDACRAILDVWQKKEQQQQQQKQQQQQQQQQSPPIVNAKDASQSTSLHKASANGHASTVQLLLGRGASHAANDSGNTPLHWAAGSGHEKCVKLLLDHYDALASALSSLDGNNNNNAKKAATMDVLQKNKFGRSALTEGFASGDHKTVEHLLNHDSAEEEKLIGGLDGKEVDDEKEANDVATGSGSGGDGDTDGDVEKKKKKSIVHEFDFLRGDGAGLEGQVDDDDGDDDRPSVLIRELPIAHADNPFGQAPIEDTTGLGIWCASLAMSRWLASPAMVQRMERKHILELGAGCGIPALTAAVYGTPKSVIITDLNPETIDNIRYNIDLNCNKRDGSESSETATTTTTTTAITTTASSLDWGDESTYPPNKLDYVICSDCIYQNDIVPLLKKVVTGLLDPNHGIFLYVAPEGGRDGLPEFIKAMKSEGFECVEEAVAPDGYRENPLKNGDEEDCFLHFGELASTVYVMYEFRRC